MDLFNHIYYDFFYAWSGEWTSDWQNEWTDERTKSKNLLNQPQSSIILWQNPRTIYRQPPAAFSSLINPDQVLAHRCLMRSWTARRYLKHRLSQTRQAVSLPQPLGLRHWTLSHVCYSGNHVINPDFRGDSHGWPSLSFCHAGLFYDKLQQVLDKTW